METKVTRFKEMNRQQKAYSIKLWNLYHESLQREDYIASWEYWNQRMEYLLELGIEQPIQSFKSSIN